MPAGTTRTATPGGTLHTSAGPDERFVEREVATRTWNEADSRLRDRVRWGPIWAGLVVAVATYLLLQLLLIALDIVDVRGGDASDAVASAVVAMVAFLLGGITAGAGAFWRDSDDGVLHGILMWATGLVVLVLLAGIGSGLVLGALDTRSTVDQFRSGPEQSATAPSNDDVKDAAGRASAAIIGALAASAVGGAIGSKLWLKERREVVRRPVAA